MGHTPTCMHSQTDSNKWGIMSLFQVSFIEHDYPKLYNCNVNIENSDRPLF